MWSSIWIAYAHWGPYRLIFLLHNTFSHNGPPINLHGSTKNLHNQTSFPYLCHYLHTNAITFLHLFTVHQVPILTLTTNPPHHPDSSTLLNTYKIVFALPHGLPPHQPHNHHIPLPPQSTPVIKPYSYPHAHKHTMTSLIQ